MRRRRIVVPTMITLTLSGCQTLGAVNEIVTSGVDIVSKGISDLVGKNESDATSVAITVQKTEAQKSKLLTSDISGFIQPVSVTDGDTFVIDKIRIRLHGIDAPELKQTCTKNGQTHQCGQIAKNVLIGFSTGESVKCIQKNKDRYGRVIGQCFVGKFDLSEGMVRSGNAVAYRKYSSDYGLSENIAKKERVGLWAGTFDMPWDWRKKYK